MRFLPPSVAQPTIQRPSTWGDPVEWKKENQRMNDDNENAPSHNNVSFRTTASTTS